MKRNKLHTRERETTGKSLQKKIKKYESCPNALYVKKLIFRLHIGYTSKHNSHHEKQMIKSHCAKKISTLLTLFRMGFFEAGQRLGGRQKVLPLPKISHTYPTMMKFGTQLYLTQRRSKNPKRSKNI